MLRLLSPIMIIFVICSCKREYKKCHCNSTNEEIKAYSEILNEIIDHRSYNYYLRKDEEGIFKDYVAHREDTSRIDREVIRLQNKLFNDTARFCKLYLDTAVNKKFRSWTYGIKDSGEFGNKVRNAVREVSDDPQSVFNVVRSAQTKYLPKDFTLCTSKMQLYVHQKYDCNPCCIGIIRLSNIFFNPAKNKGLLYYEFAGMYGSVLVIEKINGKWEIKSSIRTWMF